jgi:hypothetical protein
MRITTSIPLSIAFQQNGKLFFGGRVGRRLSLGELLRDDKCRYGISVIIEDLGNFKLGGGVK